MQIKVVNGTEVVCRISYADFCEAKVGEKLKGTNGRNYCISSKGRGILYVTPVSDQARR